MRTFLTSFGLFLGALVLLTLFQNLVTNRHTNLSFQAELLRPASLSQAPDRDGNCQGMEHRTLIYQMNGLEPDETVDVTLRLALRGLGTSTQVFPGLVLPATIGNCLNPSLGSQLQICTDTDIGYAELEVHSQSGLSGFMTGPSHAPCHSEAQNIEMRRSIE